MAGAVGAAGRGDVEAYGTQGVRRCELEDERSGRAQATKAAEPDRATLSIGAGKAPAISVARWVKGDPVPRLDLGKIYVVEFWATWCGPCRATIPHLTQLQKKNPGVTFIGVSILENDQKEVEPFVKEMGDKMDYRVAMDDVANNSDGKMAKNWFEAAGQKGIPTAFIINKEGKIAWIGHPASMDGPLEQITEGSWNLTAAIAQSRNKNVGSRRGWLDRLSPRSVRRSASCPETAGSPRTTDSSSATSGASTRGPSRAGRRSSWTPRRGWPITTSATRWPPRAVSARHSRRSGRPGTPGRSWANLEAGSSTTMPPAPLPWPAPKQAGADRRPMSRRKRASAARRWTWLRAELAAWTKYVETPGRDAYTSEAKKDTKEALEHWKQDAYLAGIRDAKPLARLPEPERKEWQALWTAVGRPAHPGPGPSARAGIRQGPDLACLRLRRQGKLAEAVAENREAIRLEPNWDEAHARLGGTLQRQGKYAEAAAAFREAVRLEPNDAVYHDGLAFSLLETGDIAAALPSIREALWLGPNSPNAQGTLVEVLLVAGRFSEAVPALERAAVAKDQPQQHAVRYQRLITRARRLAGRLGSGGPTSGDPAGPAVPTAADRAARAASEGDLRWQRGSMR